jgi:hypothetical protein
VPSSTSSSDSQLWRKTWFVALALALGLLAGWELLWRLQGFSPAINNNRDLWVLARERASKAGRDAVILIGSSRMQVGIDADAFSQATGWKRPLQLAIPMGPSLPVLRELAHDPSVSGTIICEVNLLIFFDAMRQLDRIAARHFRRRSAFTPADVIETHLKTFTQRSLVSSLPALFPQQLIRSWRTGRWPRPDHVRVDVERFGRADFRSFEGLEEFRRSRRARWKSWKGRPASVAEISRITQHLGDLLGRIRDREGDVVFVRMPTSREVRRREKRLFPRSRFWDVFAAKVDALTIHFEDHPALQGFHMPDGSHLDQRDTPAFSKALGEIIVRELGHRAHASAPQRAEQFAYLTR